MDYTSRDSIMRYWEDTLQRAFDLHRMTNEEKCKLEFREKIFLLRICWRAAWECPNDETFLMAALNHNTIERGLKLYTEICDECGKDTASLVAGITDYRFADSRGKLLREWVPDKDLKVLPWRTRKEETLKRLKRSDSRLLLLMLCRAYSELKEISVFGCKGYGADFKSLKWYYRELLKLFNGNAEIRSRQLMRWYRDDYRKFFEQPDK